MEEEKTINKIEYEQIKKANDEIQKMKVKGGEYAKVSERVKAFRKVYPTGSIITEIEDVTDSTVRIKATATDENKKVIATARASEEKKAKGNLTINLTDMIENCETSAVGRALGFAGFGIDKEIASSEDIERKNGNKKMFQIYDKMFIPDEEASYIAKLAIADLMRKMGVVKASLDDAIYEDLWTDIDSMTTNQLLKLESRLKTINMENDKWHGLYNENLKIKQVVPLNQEVVYETSTMKYGKKALELAGSDELLKNNIINYYLDRGINLAELT